MLKLTIREREVYEFIVSYIQEHGFSPSLQDICDGLFYASKQTAHAKLRQLQKKGYIELPIPNGYRAIKVIGMKYVKENSISLDKVKTAREEIKEALYNGMFSDRARAITILDKLIEESEEING